MAAHDPSWDVFRTELKHWMELRRYTSKALAEAINHDIASTGLSAPVDEQIIKRWRHSTSPPLMTLKVIARILGMSSDPSGRSGYDPTHLPRVMGVLDDAPENSELIEAAYRLQAIRAKLAEAQSALVAATTDEGVINIVRAAITAGLGTAVLPISEGPRGYPMHVSDRIDLCDPTPGAPAPDIAEHPLLADALYDAFAVVSHRVPRFCGTDIDDSMAHWSVQYLGRPRTSATHRPHPGLSALSITSVTTTPWPDDIGDLTAMVLGYGFTTTRELARELVSDPYAAEALRSDIHDNFLYAATPQCRVWTHHDSALAMRNAESPLRDPQGRVANHVVHVCLVEDDACLRRSAEMPPGGTTRPSPQEVEERFARLVAARDATKERVAASRDERVFAIPVTVFAEPEDRWQQVLTVTLRILQILRDLGVEANVSHLHDRLVRTDPQVAPQLLRWLADHDAPFVESRHRTLR